MVALLALAAVAIVLLVIVPTIVTAVARAVMAGRPRNGPQESIDQDLAEARLGRIEEAIDAMAQQIERLTEQQRALLGAQRGSIDVASDRSRTENPG